MKKLVWFCALAGLVALLPSCSEELNGGSLDQDSAQLCGDGMCHVSELGACEQDCGVGAAVCGNGRCGATETAESCPEDCSVSDSPNNDNPDDPPDPVSCDYPGGPGSVTYGEVHPALSWPTALDENGEEVGLDMREFFCSPKYDDYNSVAFILGTGWCPACPDYMRHGASIANEAQANGMLMVFVEAEDRNYVPSSSADAAHFLEPLLNAAPGLRIGDGDTQPTARTLYNSPVVTAFPAAWVVRRSDMRVIAAQSRSQFILPFIQIAQDPEGEWDGAVDDSVQSNCGEEDEEIYEPNDDPKDAPLIGPGSFDGGVCGTAPDYYSIDLEGAWRLDLEFTHSEGDLDVYVWNNDTNEPLMQDGRAVGSESISDNESFEFAGPATIMVFGYNFATTTYGLTLTDLSAE